MIIYKSPAEIEIMRESALLVSKTLGLMAEKIEPGITPNQLDKMADEFIRDNDAVPGFLGLYDYPKSIITSVNEQVVHGIPTDRPLEEGDVVGVDIGVFKNGYYGDHAYTFPVGEIDKEVRKLLRVTKESLDKGIEQLVAGNRIGDVSFAVQKHAENFGYGVVRELVGHGLGKRCTKALKFPTLAKEAGEARFKKDL